MGKIDWGSFILFVVFIWSLVVVAQGTMIEVAPPTSVSTGFINGLAIVGVGLAGMSFAYSSWCSKKNEVKLYQNNILLHQIIEKLDSGVIITQNISAVINDEKPKKIGISLMLRGTMIGVLAGIIGGFLVNSVFELASYVEESPKSPALPFPSFQVLIFILSLGLIIGLVLYVARIIDKLEDSDSPYFVLRR